MSGTVARGGLFGREFLSSGIELDEMWAALTADKVAEIDTELGRLIEAFPASHNPNEQQTEDDLIWPILRVLGWNDHLRQQNLSVSGRDDVPDGILFANAAAKSKANEFGEEWRRYGFGVAIVESKRWDRPLDRRGRRGEELAPSTQMLRYLRRVDDITGGDLRWGILTNGARWRLYWQGARSVSEQFFEFDLGGLMDAPGQSLGLFKPDEAERTRLLRIFVLVFRREAFLPSSVDRRTFHLRSLDQARFYEERTANDLSDLVFGNVYPLLVRSFVDAAPDAPLDEVREASLVLLYRVLFVLYAEDRNLLPVDDERYDDYGLRERVRMDVKKRKDARDAFSTAAARYWSILNDLCRAIDAGDPSIGLPPYNGGLFATSRAPLLERVRLADSMMAEVIDALSFRIVDGQRRYINYRDLSVQQLGSIYERLLEFEVVRDGGSILIRPNTFARKGSGSYYTPEDLVGLIIRETVAPLVERALADFREASERLAENDASLERREARLRRADPAECILDLKVCDPAMGSGHFLVSLVDYLTDQVIAAIAEAENAVEWTNYSSPVIDRISSVRTTILENAEAGGWVVNEAQLDDRHIVRRMVLKRCIYGVDKNTMAVELAKVALWLSSFTVGAPLSFLDHHLRHGDSLFGSFVHAGLDAARDYGSPLLLLDPIKKALASATAMREIESIPDAEISETDKSARIFEGVRVSVAPLDAFLSYVHALQWLNLKDRNEKAAVQSFFDGEFGDVFEIAAGGHAPRKPGSRTGEDRSQMEGNLSPEEKLEQFALIHARVRELIEEEAFLNWQVAFPGVWDDWEEGELRGGFDAVIGNPPWDRMKLQQVEWFAARDPDIAQAPRAADRRRMIARLARDDGPLHADYEKATERAAAGVRVARRGGDYPLLSGGDLNLYSLFVERAMRLVKPDGMVGLLVPSGIASDKSASRFFRGVATEGRLRALYDFENRRTRHRLEPFFPSVDSRFKFAAFVASPTETAEPAACAFFLQSVEEAHDEDRRFTFTAENFEAVNPNTGTAPILRSRRDADLVTAIYANASVLVDRRTTPPTKLWPVDYERMLDMTNDSEHFRTLEELQTREQAYARGGNVYRSKSGDWLPLYVGRMIHQFDHRAASVDENAANLHNAALSGDVSVAEKANPDFVPTPLYWVPEAEVTFPPLLNWTVAFRDIARATDMRTMIAAIGPRAGYGNTVPILIPEGEERYREGAALMLGNMNALPFDYVTRSKAQSTHLNWYIVEQLPFIPPEQFKTKFGSQTAGEIVRDLVVRLTYTAHDMADFARDNGYVDEHGDVLSPVKWGETERVHMRAKLDAVFFHLYGITDRNDVAYIYSTFPIQERHETRDHGHYLSRDLCLEYINILAAGQPDDEPVLAA